MPKLRNSHHFFDYLILSGEARSDGTNTYRYSNLSYLILGLVIEANTERSYEQFCKAEIFKPLGITSAYIPSRWQVIAPFGGWFMTPIDILKMWRSLDIYESKVLDRFVLKTLLLGEVAVPVPDKPGITYSMGAFIRPSEDKTTYVLTHDGISDFYGLAPTYFTYVQKSVPGPAWVVSMAPTPSRETSRAIVRALTQFVAESSR